MAAANGLFLQACRREEVERTPVWIMRQAGRYLPEYREVRQEFDFLIVCKTPELAAKVTMQPVDRLGVDAAILFSDILIPLEGMGIDLRFDPGPVIDDPVRDRASVEALRTPDPRDSVPFVMDAIHLVRERLPRSVPLIGFAGAPFTMAAYLVEGHPSAGFPTFRALLYRDPKTADLLMEKITDMVSLYLEAQVQAGAQAVQLFETWAGLTGPEAYVRFALPHVRRIMDHLRPLGVPLIYYAGNGGSLLEQIKECGAHVIGVDWRLPLDRAWERLGRGLAIQGNLDPCALFAPKDLLEQQVARVLAEAASRPGHIFNLGHGILPDTPWESAAFLVETVHSLSERK